jgi:cytochrome c2
MGLRHHFDDRARTGRLTRPLVAAAVIACAGLGAPASQAADIAKGQAAFVRQCAICHTIDKGAENRLGPNLFGIVGRRADGARLPVHNAFRNTATFEWTEGLLGPWMPCRRWWCGAALGVPASPTSKRMTSSPTWRPGIAAFLQ